MSALTLKAELMSLIEKEKNTPLLHVLRDILTGKGKSSLLKAKLTSRALRSEADIAAGRLFTTDQMRGRLAARRRK